jgi:hypothetical protein
MCMSFAFPLKDIHLRIHPNRTFIHGLSPFLLTCTRNSESRRFRTRAAQLPRTMPFISKTKDLELVLLASCSTKWFFSLESGDINLHESLFFVVQNPFLNAEMDSAC